MKKIIEKSIAKFVEKALEESPALGSVLDVVETLAAELHKLAVSNASLTRTVAYQQDTLKGLYLRQEMMLSAMQEKSRGITLPPLFKEKVSKPN